MRVRRRVRRRGWWWVVGGWWLASSACGGPAGSSETVLPFDLFVSQAVADRLSGFQVAILPNGRSFDCFEIPKTCLNTQVTADKLARVTGPDGKQQPVAFFPAQLSDGGTVVTQDVVVSGIPVGKDYAVVIEALSNDATPKLLGSSCNYQPEIRAGSNDRLIANAINVPDGGAAACDPRFQ